MRHVTIRRRRVLGVANAGRLHLVTAVGVGPAWATVTAVNGSAYGCRAYNINLLGGSHSDTRPAQSVALAADATNSPQSASAASGTVSYGPAVLFTSDDVVTSASGSTGATGSVTSSADVYNINKSTTQPTITGSEILTADQISSACTANSSTPSGSNSITTGTLRTDSGLDLNGDGDYLDAGEHAPVDATLSSSPAANTRPTDTST